ncbi:MAG: hypothetical protein SGJ00_07820 [bacterium]|nr:hypothetical protein [bacterium]
MKAKDIQNHDDLLMLIAETRDRVGIEEKIAFASFKVVVKTLNPLALIKDSLHDLFSDKELVQDVKSFGIKTGANFVIDKVLGKNKSIKGFIYSILAENVSEYLLNKRLKKAKKEEQGLD